MATSTTITNLTDSGIEYDSVEGRIVARRIRVFIDKTVTDDKGNTSIVLGSKNHPRVIAAVQAYFDGVAFMRKLRMDAKQPAVELYAEKAALKSGFVMTLADAGSFRDEELGKKGNVVFLLSEKRGFSGTPDLPVCEATEIDKETMAKLEELGLDGWDTSLTCELSGKLAQDLKSYLQSVEDMHAKQATRRAEYRSAQAARPPEARPTPPPIESSGIAF